MKLPYEEFDLSTVTTYPLKSRRSKAHVDDFAHPYQKGAGITGLMASLPKALAARDLTAIVRAVVNARAKDAPIIWGIGAHVIKVGLGPVLIDLMEKGFVSAVATNGAGIIHDFEVALVGATSEEVEEALGPGRFGMADETGRLLNGAINEGVAKGLGLGQAIGQYLRDLHPQFERHSVAAAAARLDIPLTVHIALGTDITHMHSAASGSSLGEGSLRDFRFLASSVARLRGGVYFNCGSAVVLPEVFLKAVALARNQGADLTGLSTVNLDFVRLYRPETNVVQRPTAGIGQGYSLVGHHELMIPLLAAAIVEAESQ